MRVFGLTARSRLQICALARRRLKSRALAPARKLAGPICKARRQRRPAQCCSRRRCLRCRARSSQATRLDSARLGSARLGLTLLCSASARCGCWPSSPLPLLCSALRPATGPKLASSIDLLARPTFGDLAKCPPRSPLGQPASRMRRTPNRLRSNCLIPLCFNRSQGGGGGG